MHLVALAAGWHFNLIHDKTFPCTHTHSAPLKIEMGQFISNKRWTLCSTFSLNTSYLLIYHHQSLSMLSRVYAHIHMKVNFLDASKCVKYSFYPNVSSPFCFFYSARFANFHTKKILRKKETAKILEFPAEFSLETALLMC